MRNLFGFGLVLHSDDSNLWVIIIPYFLRFFVVLSTTLGVGVLGREHNRWIACIAPLQFRD